MALGNMSHRNGTSVIGTVSTPPKRVRHVCFTFIIAAVDVLLWPVPLLPSICLAGSLRIIGFLAHVCAVLTMIIVHLLPPNNACPIQIGCACKRSDSHPAARASQRQYLRYRCSVHHLLIMDSIVFGDLLLHWPNSMPSVCAYHDVGVICDVSSVVPSTPFKKNNRSAYVNSTRHSHSNARA